MRNLSRKASIGQTGVPASGRSPSCQHQSAARSMTAGSAAMMLTGTSWLTASPRTMLAGLMVAQDYEHQILVVELLHERGHCIAPTSIGCHFDPIAAGATAMTEAADHHSCRYLLVPQRL